MRKKSIISISKPEQYKKKLLSWSQQFNEVLWLDGNAYDLMNSKYDAVLAVDALTVIQTDAYGAFEQLKEFQTITKDWIFGYLSYDLKNDVEKLASKNKDRLQFPELFFFQPKKLFLLKGETLEVQYLNLVADEWQQDLVAIEAQEVNLKHASAPKINIQPRIKKQDYLLKVEEMLAHIHRGDIYEANFCMEFFAEAAQINPLAIYQSLNAISTPPFASFFKNYDQFAMSASPERYIKKEGLKVASQPIKGTARRSSNTNEDQLLKQQLSEDIKERSENVMIVDLVRNDLSKTALKGTVTVEELCKVHTFKQVHQMISTVSSQIGPEVHPIDVLRTTFPMGSMTGAPKISAMTIIEALEESKRGLYSGAMGYITPKGDFDFSVVIRSILYNAYENYASYTVGSAITAKSDPEKEFEECLLKAKAMREVLENSSVL